jgi:hypothetical protein
VLEWTHLNLADELRFDLSVSQNSREQFVKVRKEKIHLIVDCRIKSG